MNYKALKVLDRLRARIEANLPGHRCYYLQTISPEGMQGIYGWHESIYEAIDLTSDEVRVFEAIVIKNDVTQTIAVVYDGLVFVPVGALVTAQDEDDEIPF